MWMFRCESGEMLLQLARITPTTKQESAPHSRGLHALECRGSGFESRAVHLRAASSTVERENSSSESRGFSSKRPCPTAGAYTHEDREVVGSTPAARSRGLAQRQSAR